jgi:hypothetical protein
LGGLAWDFIWISDSTQKVGQNSPQKPDVAPETQETHSVPAYDTVRKSQTIDPTAVPVTIEKLGDVLIGAGFAPTAIVPVLGRITLSTAAKENTVLRPPTDGSEGIYYKLSVAQSPDDLGEVVLVDATTGKVYRKT